MKCTKLFTLLPFLFLFSLKSTAQEVPPKLAIILQHTLDSMHQVLGTIGLSAAVQLQNDAVWAGGSGVSTFFPLDSISAQHHFATGDAQKTVTAACILQLADEGALSLDDSLSALLPNYQYLDPTITVRQLLRHESGLREIFTNPDFQPQLAQNPNQIWDLEDVITTFLQAPDFAPGTNWSFSNTNYIVLGMIIEAVTGNSYHEEINERFFTPMGLESMVNLAYDPLPFPIAHLWLDITGDMVLDDAHNAFVIFKSMFSAIGPAGAYFATPHDMAKWIRASMNGSMFEPETWQAAIETVSPGLPGATRYGLGIMERNYLGLKSYGHGGDINYSTSAVYFPDKDISIVVQANDASENSWSLAATVSALLKSYLDCEAALSAIDETTDATVRITTFPNPFTDQMTIAVTLPETNADVFCQVNDLTGRTIWSSASQKTNAPQALTFTVDKLAFMPTGIYFLSVFANEQVIHSCKIVKQAS